MANGDIHLPNESGSTDLYTDTSMGVTYRGKKRKIDRSRPPYYLEDTKRKRSKSRKKTRR